MGEAWSGESHDLPGRLVADHVEVVLQRGVLRALEIHQLGGLIDPDLCRERGLRDRQGQALLLCQPNVSVPAQSQLRTHTDHDGAAQGRGLRGQRTHIALGELQTTQCSDKEQPLSLFVKGSKHLLIKGHKKLGFAPCRLRGSHPLNKEDSVPIWHLTEPWNHSGWKTPPRSTINPAAPCSPLTHVHMCHIHTLLNTSRGGDSPLPWPACPSA